MDLDPKAFDAQMNRLKVLPTQGGHENATEFAMRKAVYYDALNDLDTQRFVNAARALLSESGRVYFPTPGELRAQAEAPAPVTALLMVPRRTPEEIAAGKEAARKGLALIRAEAEKRMGKLPDPVKRMSSDAPEPAA